MAYKYNCIDKSIVLPYFKKYYVELFYRLIPYPLTANYITLISSGLMVGLLVTILLTPNISSTSLALIIAFCLNGYVVGDHLDGMHAKNTKTGSQLGEFLDHYLDVYNGAITAFVIIFFVGDIPDIVFYAFLWLNFLAFAATMMEELERKELIFGPIGTLEGIIALFFFILSWCIPDIQDFWNSEMLFGLQWYWLVILISGAGYLGTLIDILVRVGYSPKPFSFFCGCSLILALTLFLSKTNHVLGWLIMTLHAGEYIAKVMESYLIEKKPHRYPNIPAAVIILILFPLFSKTPQWTYISFAVYLAVKVIFSFGHIVYQMREFWYWVNPKREIDTK